MLRSGEAALKSSDGKGDFSSLQEARQLITGLIPQLYQKLNADAESDSNRAVLLAVLQTHQWIWVGETFVSADCVAITTSVNATPYLYQLPQDLQVYSKLLSVFGVKHTFSSRDYIQVLRQLADDTGASALSSTQNSSQSTKQAAGANVAPLSDASVDLAVSLVTMLSAEGSINPHVHTIYAPDSTGRLAISTELVNDDVPWLSGPEYASTRVGCRLIHPNISSLVAEKLGVKSLRLTLVNQNAEQNLFSAPQNAVEAFGQAESLTSRLKTILDLYPEGNPIFSELIQNADDAGASTVYIMLDENSYPTESLLDSKMAPLQGPALIFANDAMFTEADYRSKCTATVAVILFMNFFS
jgi:sacsin